MGERLLLSLVTKERLTAILSRLLDETEFLSPYGIRSLSKYHEKHPFEMNVNGVEYMVKYLPGESDSGMFGGNSNWRGPIWFPTSFLIMEALQRFYLYYGSDFKVECPVGSGDYLNLAEVAEELGYRMIHLFVPDENGSAPFIMVITLSFCLLIHISGIMCHFLNTLTVILEEGLALHTNVVGLLLWPNG